MAQSIEIMRKMRKIIVPDTSPNGVSSWDIILNKKFYTTTDRPPDYFFTIKDDILTETAS